MPRKPIVVQKSKASFDDVVRSPFLGDEIKIIPAGTGFFGVAEGFSTKIFSSLFDLKAFLQTRDGVKPGWSNIVVTHTDAPADDPFADVRAKDAKLADKLNSELGDML